MAEETKGEEPPPAVPDDGEGPSSPNKNGKQRYKRDDTPIEELFDLTKPIPRVERPSKDEHEAQLAEISAAMDAFKEERTELQNKIDFQMDQGKNTAIGKEREALSKLRAKKGELIEEKKIIRTKLDQTRNQADRLQKDRSQTKQGVRFTSIEEIDAEIAKLNRRQETTSMSLNEEKRLIKEMDALQASKKVVAELKTKESSLEQTKEMRKAIQAQINAKDKEIDAVQKEIEVKAANVKAMSEKETGKRDALQSLFTERDELRKKMTEKIKERDVLRQEFREKNNAWYNYRRAIQAQKKMQYEEEKKKKEEERQAWLKKKEEEEAKKIPYEEEMALCDYLANYLTVTYLTDAEELKRQQEEEAEKKRAADVVAVKEDPFAGFKPVQKNDDETYFQSGKGKKKKGGKKKGAKKSSAKTGPFTLNVDSFEQFGLLQLTPPTSIDMVANSVEELKAKKKWYSEQPRGSVPTAADIRKASEKEAAKIKGSGGENGQAASPSKTRSKKGGFDLSNDDFVPLGAGSATSSSLNASWGQKPLSAPAATEEVAAAPAEDAVAEET